MNLIFFISIASIFWDNITKKSVAKETYLELFEIFGLAIAQIFILTQPTIELKPPTRVSIINFVSLFCFSVGRFRREEKKRFSKHCSHCPINIQEAFIQKWLFKYFTSWVVTRVKILNSCVTKMCEECPTVGNIEWWVFSRYLLIYFSNNKVCK